MRERGGGGVGSESELRRSELRVISKTDCFTFLITLQHVHAREGKRLDYKKHCGGGGGACDRTHANATIGILYPQSACVPTPCIPSLEPQPG